MTGCQIITILNHLLDQNPNHHFRVHKNNNVIVIGEHNVGFHKNDIHGDIFFITEPIPPPTLAFGIIDITDLNCKVENEKISNKPWYVEASEKGGNKKRKPFIK